jgi:hypothetical protein
MAQGVPIKISEEMIDLILRLYDRGDSAYEISKKCGISDSRVRTTLMQNGIKMRSSSETMKMSSSERRKNKKVTHMARTYPDRMEK